MKRMQLLLLTLLVFNPLYASAATWKVDPDHSTALFKIQHMMISTVQGNFTEMAGTVQEDGGDLKQAQVEIRIAAASINTNQAKRDAHLKSADFFDVATYPTLTFRSKQVQRGEQGLVVVGDLTMHGVTREVKLQMEEPSAEVKDPWGNIRKGIKGTTTLNRKDFGLGWNQILESGGLLVGEEVEISLAVELIKQAG